MEKILKSLICFIFLLAPQLAVSREETNGKLPVDFWRNVHGIIPPERRGFETGSGKDFKEAYQNALAKVPNGAIVISIAKGVRCCRLGWIYYQEYAKYGVRD